MTSNNVDSIYSITMAVSIPAKDGYFTCDKHYLSQEQSEDYDGVMLYKNGNGFGWDVSCKQEYYQFFLKIKWLPDQTKIKKNQITLNIKYGDVDIENENTDDLADNSDIDTFYNGVYYEKHITLGNLETHKNVGNETHILTFLTVPLLTSKKICVYLDNIKTNILISSLMIQKGNKSITLGEQLKNLIKPTKLNHGAGSIHIRDEIKRGLNVGDNLDDTEATNYGYGVIRSFIINNHVPHTDYGMTFKNGCVKIYLRDNDTSGIGFQVNNNGKIPSIPFVVPTDSSIVKYNTKCQILFKTKIKENVRYQLYLRIKHQTHFDKIATFYELYFREQSVTKWTFIGKICRYGKDYLGKTSAYVRNQSHNGHLYQRSFKYGMGWNLNHDGQLIPVQKMSCFSSNEYKNSLVKLDNPKFMAIMNLGGNIGTTTPNSEYVKRRNTDKTPTVPLKFELQLPTEV